MKYLVSIIIPLFNNEQYINRCIDSVLAQTYKNIEIIVIDDGSTDNSLKKVKMYKDNRLKCYSKKNEGVSVARNYGIEKSSGDYLLFVDSDDYVDCEMVQLMINKVKNLESIVLCDNYEIWNNRVEKRELFNYSNPKLSKNIILRDIASGKAGLVCSKLVSSKIIRKYNIEFDTNLVFGEDQLFFLQVSQYIKEFIYINKSLYFYDRTNEKSATIKYQKNMYNNFEYLLSKVINIFNDNYMTTDEDIKVLNRKKLMITWICINNEANAINKIGIKNAISNIKGLLDKSKDKLCDIKEREGKIEQIVYNAIQSKNKSIESIKLIIIIKMLNLKIRIKNRK